MDQQSCGRAGVIAIDGNMAARNERNEKHCLRNDVFCIIMGYIAVAVPAFEGGKRAGKPAQGVIGKSFRGDWRIRKNVEGSNCF